ncbi:hypothetical protein CEXT_309461 [Caerostris extrusa]|uniref:Uncharacterized protein n=1 Tax=Caerostris extrusa TaxID=172846 RepID=A0AAV4RK84_CAEEX|nr:hypothetical protein CEXT_309461 [Caerostris extrusa]
MNRYPFDKISLTRLQNLGEFASKKCVFFVGWQFDGMVKNAKRIERTERYKVKLLSRQNRRNSNERERVCPAENRIEQKEKTHLFLCDGAHGIHALTHGHRRFGNCGRHDDRPPRLQYYRND